MIIKEKIRPKVINFFNWTLPRRLKFFFSLVFLENNLKKYILRIQNKKWNLAVENRISIQTSHLYIEKFKKKVLFFNKLKYKVSFLLL